MKLTGQDVAYLAGTLLAGFVAYKVYKTAAAITATGGKVADAVIEGAKKVITEDLNPASDKNVVYTGVSSVVNAIAHDGEDLPLGVRAYNFFHPSEKTTLPGDKPMVSKTTSLDTAVSQLAQEDFRRAEIKAENADALQLANASAKSEDLKSSFRISEIIDAKPFEPITPFEDFLMQLRGN